MQFAIFALFLIGAVASSPLRRAHEGDLQLEDVSWRANGIVAELVDSATGEPIHTFSGLGHAKKVLLTVTGESDALGDVTFTLTVGSASGSQTTLYPSGYRALEADVTNFVSADGNLEVRAHANAQAAILAGLGTITVHFSVEVETDGEGLETHSQGLGSGDVELDPKGQKNERHLSNITINYHDENGEIRNSQAIHLAYAKLNEAREDAKLAEPIIRLFNFAGKHSNHGRLEAKLSSDDTWSTVCDDNFDENNGIVACRQLGFAGYERHRTVTTPLGFIGSMASVNRIQFDNFDCNGDEAKLTDCVGTFGESDCLHTEDVVLYCTGEQTTTINEAKKAASAALVSAQKDYITALESAGCEPETQYYDHAKRGCKPNSKAGETCSPELHDADCKMYEDKDKFRIQMYCVDNWEQGFGYTAELRSPDNDFVCSCTPRPDFSDYTTSTRSTRYYSYSSYYPRCDGYNFEWECMAYEYDGSVTYFAHVCIVAGLAGLACCCCISSSCVSKFCGNTRGCLTCCNCGCCPDCCSRQCGETMCSENPTCEPTAFCGICGCDSKGVHPRAWFTSAALCMCCVPMIGLSAAQTGLVNDGAAQSFSEQFGCLEKYAGPDHEYGYLTYAGWAIAFFCLTVCSCCSAFAVCIKGIKSWRDDPDGPGVSVDDATRKYALRATTFSFLCSIAAFSMPLSKAKSWRWIGWATWAQIGLTLTIFPLMYAVLNKHGIKYFLGSIGWVLLGVFFIGGIILAIKLINETEVFDSEDGGFDLKTSAMFGIIAGILLLSQGGARLLRSRAVPLPALVEFIIFCSSLDLVSDIIYFVTATFHSDELEFLSIGFCVLPFIALVCAFIFRCYRLVTLKNLKWRLRVATWSFTVVDSTWHLTLLYPAFAACYTVVVGTFLFFVSLPVEVILQILRLGIVAGYAASKETGGELSDFVTEETGTIWKFAGSMFDSAQDTAMSWMELSFLMLPPTVLMFVVLFVVVLIATTIMLIIFILGYVVALPAIMIFQTLFWIAASLFFPIFWAVMVMMRTFAIFPDAWRWLENQCEWYTSHMKQMADEGIFVYKPREIAEKSGQDLGVFKVFHPKLKEAQNIPEIDDKALYMLISGTLIFEFVFETAPQIILQTINNFKIQEQYTSDRRLYEDTYGNSTNVSLPDGMFARIPADPELFPDRPNNQPVLGWTPFAIACIAVSLTIALDALYRQWFQVCCLGKDFGSSAVWSRGKGEDRGQDPDEVPELEPRVESDVIAGIRKNNFEDLAKDSEMRNKAKERKERKKQRKEFHKMKPNESMLTYGNAIGGHHSQIQLQTRAAPQPLGPANSLSTKTEATEKRVKVAETELDAPGIVSAADPLPPPYTDALADDDATPTSKRGAAEVVILRQPAALDLDL